MRVSLPFGQQVALQSMEPGGVHPNMQLLAHVDDMPGHRPDTMLPLLKQLRNVEDE